MEWGYLGYFGKLLSFFSKLAQYWHLTAKRGAVSSRLNQKIAGIVYVKPPALQGGQIGCKG